MYKEKHTVKNHYSSHKLSRYLDVYELNTVNCSADKTTGYKGTEVTLIDDAAWNEKFSAWALTGATATGNNIVLNNDVTAQGMYETAKNVTYNTRTSGNKVSGFIGDQVTITGTPAWNQKTSSYSVTGATLTGNKFNFTGSNVTAQANFETAKSITTQNCSANKVSGFSGDNVTVTGTPAWNQKLSGYGITGATLTGNNFKIANSNVTVQGKYETAKNVTLQTDGHGTIAANKTSGFIGDTITLSNTANVGYTFNTYTLTGATLTGNQFNMTGSNVTAKATFTVNGVPVIDTTGFSADIALNGSVFLDNYRYFAFMFEQFDKPVTRSRDNTMVSANLKMASNNEHIYSQDYGDTYSWPSTGDFTAIPYNHCYVVIGGATNVDVPVALDNTVWTFWTHPDACAIDSTPFDNQWHAYKYIVCPTYTMSNAQYICCKDYVPKVSGILGAPGLVYDRFTMTLTGRGPTSAVKNLKARYFYTLEDALAWRY